MGETDGGCCTPSREPSDAAGATPAAPAATAVPVVDTRALAGGEFLMGSVGEGAYPDDGEGPVRRIRVSPFAIAAHTVSNAEFAAFVGEPRATSATRSGSAAPSCSPACCPMTSRPPRR